MGDPRRILIVDGYNVVFRLFPGAAGGAARLRDARRDLEVRLSDLAARDDVEIWVDYDGAEAPGLLPEATSGASVRVRYTEPPAEADDAIVQRARQMVDERRLPVTVVSGDRELSRRVREVGASVESVEDLALRLRRLRVPASTPVEAPEEEARLRAIHERQERIAAHAAAQDRRRDEAGAAESVPEDGPAITPRERRLLRGRRRQARRLRQAGAAGKRRKKRGRG